MISSKQWDAIMTYTGYGSGTRPNNTYEAKPDLSGASYKTDSTKYDVSKNIYDLAGNVYEFTITASEDNYRVSRGDYYDASSGSASYSNDYFPSSFGGGLRF